MRLSILIPTHRSDLLACSRIVQACSWGGPELEVIVRDNSGNVLKRNLLAQIKRDHCNIIVADPCGPVENYAELVRLAKGDFAFIVADDDLGFDRGIASLPGLIGEHVNDRSIVGIAGTYAIEHPDGSAIVGYQNVDSDDVVVRVSGYLGHQGVNALIYSPIRRELLQRIFQFITAMPFRFSFHDQVACLLYLLNGKFVRLKRLMYLYDVGNWDAAGNAQAQDLAFYTASNLDPAINKLHWFICGFEGAVLIRNSDMFPDYAPAQRQTMADRWFSAMYLRFKNSTREAYGSRLTREAEALCEKWRQSAGRLSFHDMLADIGNFIALSSKDGAHKYHDYWNSTLSKSGSGKTERRT